MSFEQQHTTSTTTPVLAKLQYLDDSSKDSNEAPIYYASQPGNKEEAKHAGTFCFHDVLIHSARGMDFSIDREGFQLLPQKSKVQDFFDDNELAKVYNREIEELLLANVQGATRVKVFDHTRRTSSADLRTKLNCREPAAIIHNDYTEKSATKRLRDMLGPEANDLLQKRFSIVNVWRSIAGTVQQSHITWCDSTSLSPGDLVSVKRVAQDRIGELQFSYYNPAHQWFFFPATKMDEVAIFKTYDSVKDLTTNRFTIHTAFTDPSTPINAPPRQSIETRAFVFYA